MPTTTARKPPQKVGFIRLESYGFKSSKGRRTISGVINEMTRRPSAIPHVSEPLAEIPLFCPFGPPSGAIPLIRQKVAEFDSQSPKRMRKDAQLLVAGVASYPTETKDMLENPQEWRAFGEFCEYTITFLREEFGERVHSVVAHIDERFPHVHFMLLPYNVPESGGKLGIGANHPGKHADDRGPNRREKYKAAMKAFLDRFYEKVGKLMGWARIGAEPRQRNPNRKQYLWFRNLWESLTNTSDGSEEALENAALVEASVPESLPTSRSKPAADEPFEGTEPGRMKHDGNADEMRMKSLEIFHDPSKQQDSPMKLRF